MNAPVGDTPQSLTGLHVVDAEGAKLGLVQQVYRDDATDEPEWITVRTGLFGLKETFVPLAGARRVGDELHLPHTKHTIKETPRIDAHGHLDPSEEDRLYRHYGLIGPGPSRDTGAPGAPGTPGPSETGGTGGAAGAEGGPAG
ncbi:PRC-barrel domain-containing protein, partial [Streptomyces sp. 769]|uniref:PRC-barrel domain-containing protein n=1 Tax=Streptomyces sp. 769 TaxID=1262452 RepID=UPI00057DE671|nr:PRC-barrel domain protein [Streptomyces sp. 769]